MQEQNGSQDVRLELSFNKNSVSEAHVPNGSQDVSLGLSFNWKARVKRRNK